MSRPTDLKYAKTHEWVRIEKDIATTGISDFAIAALSDLVYIDMPQVTDLLEEGQELNKPNDQRMCHDPATRQGDHLSRDGDTTFSVERPRLHHVAG